MQELIAELEPRAMAAAEQLAESARTLHDAHSEWHDVSAKVSGLLRHVPGVHDAPGDHALPSVARDVRNFLRQSREVAPPLPRKRATVRYETAESTEVAA